MKSVSAVLIALSVVGAACAQNGQGEPTRPLVIATTTILGDIVANTAGGGVRVEALMPVGADPHGFSPSARQAAGLRHARLVVANGVGLEEGLLDVLDAAEGDGVPVLRVGDHLDPQPLAPRGAADYPGSLDPHVWMDPVRMADAVLLIAGRLGEAGVDVADSAASYRSEILSLHDQITEMIGSLPPDRRKLVTNHFSYGYFADRYGLALLGTVIPAATTGAEASAADFARLVDIIEQEGVTVVFGSTSEPTTLADALAGEVGYRVEVVELFTGSLGGPGSGAETYLDMMRTNTRLIVESLQPEGAAWDG